MAITGTAENPVEVLVVQGGCVLTVGGPAQRLVPGSTFEVLRDTPHSGRCWPEGATFSVRS